MRLIALALVVGVAVVAWMGGFGRAANVVRPADADPSPAHQPGERTVQLTETELSQRLTQQLVGKPLGSTPLGPAMLTRIAAHLGDGRLQADGDAQVAAATVPVSLSASASVKDGRALVLVDDLRAAGVSLPSSTRDAVQQSLQTQLDQQVDQLQMRLTSISIDSGKLTLVGTPRS